MHSVEMSRKKGTRGDLARCDKPPHQSVRGRCVCVRAGIAAERGREGAECNTARNPQSARNRLLIFCIFRATKTTAKEMKSRSIKKERRE